MIEPLIIAGLFVDFVGAFVVLYDEYVIAKFKRITKDVQFTEKDFDRISNGEGRLRRRKWGLIFLMLGFLIQITGHFLPI